MEGTDVETGYKDSNITHDHTFFGNGCRVTWAEGGSPEACSTRIVSTYDSEDQKNGTYYQYQAASSGSGAAVAVKYTATPDSFCPLGWQLPYGGTGGDYYDQSRSWKYLFEAYSINGDQSGSNKIRSYPLSYIFSGIYNYADGLLRYFGSHGMYWSETIYNGTQTFRFYLQTSNNGVDYDNRVRGQAVRCAHRFSVQS